jgi:two-component system sensor histidine kinase AlgZ
MALPPKQAAVHDGLLPYLCSGPAVFGLVIAGELIAFALVLVKSSLMTFSWAQLGYMSMVVQWIVLLSALLLCQLTSVFARFSAVVSGCLAYVSVLAISLGVLMAALWLVEGWIDGLLLLKNMILSAIFSGIILRYLYLQQQLRNQQQAELQSRIQALHARIRPHFLFNSMNAVASLIPVDPDLAEKVVEDLSQLFRVSLQEMSLVSLDEEIALCRSYTDIEQIRLGERLQIDWRFDHGACKTLVPSLILQPLIENAIYHGVQRLPDGGTIQVSSWLDAKHLVLKVINPLPELSDNHTDTLSSLTDGSKNNRMALGNIEHRLHAHYGREASIDLQQKQGAEGKASYYEVTLTIPVDE